MARRLTDAELGARVRMYADGMTLRQIAAHDGVGIESVRQSLLKARVRLRPRSRTGPGEDREAEIVALYQDGVGIMEISTRLRHCPKTVSRIVNQTGVRRRPKQYQRKRPVYATRTEVFLSRIEVRDGCWWWTGSTVRKGPWITGQLRVDGNRKVQTNRFAYELWIGRIPDDHEVEQECGNGLCVNPDHLIAVKRGAHLRGAARVPLGGRNKDVATWRYDWAERRASTPIVCDRGHWMLAGNRMEMQRPDGLTEARCRQCWQESVAELVADMPELDETPRERFRRERAEGIR